jgi:16S rRNA C967 or C1407 C5-methylase (RsmB/RsmF family)/NOL1/NOP2/fmu family ribosome biogenesis protein
MELPEAFKENITNQLGKESNLFFEALDKPSPISIRLNSKKATDSVINGSNQVKWHTEGRYLDTRPIFTLDPLFQGGAYYVQEASSMFLKEVFSQIENRKEPIKVLDMCAAPGGKSSLIADLLGPEDILVVNEAIKSRISILKENLQKWGYENVIYVNQDPETFADLEGFFDVVLVDAPCSGEGLFRKDPDAANHWSTEAVKMCSLRQQRILSAAAMLVKKEGVLIYSTCTYNPSENQENVNWLCRTLDFEKIDIKVKKEWNLSQSAEGIQFYPHKNEGEGFFIAAMRQNTNERNNLKARVNMHMLNFGQEDKIKPWVRPDIYEKYSFFAKQDGGIVALTESLLPAYGVIFKALSKRSSGFELGVLKGKDLVPSPSFALSSFLHNDITKVEINLETALLFFKRETFELEGAQNGWILLTYQNVNLGFVKKIDGRINNYWPTEWRVRMEIQQ